MEKSTMSRRKAPQNKTKPLNNIEIVTLAVYLLGGRSLHVDTEDVAKKANELAPGRFAWKKYPDQIDIHNIGKRLCDAKNLQRFKYLLGSFKEGWHLSKLGLRFCKKRAQDFKVRESTSEESPFDSAETLWQSRERTRMLGSSALELLKSKGEDAVTAQEAEAFFRIDDYIVGEARKRKVNRIVDIFKNDPELGDIVITLAKRVRER